MTLDDKTWSHKTCGKTDLTFQVFPRILRFFIHKDTHCNNRSFLGWRWSVYLFSCIQKIHSFFYKSM
jgi:hypothetical protein